MRGTAFQHEHVLGTGDPFRAVPQIADGVETRETASGLVQIRKLPAPKPGLAARLAVRLGFRRQIRVDLDTVGSVYWKHIDGRRTLRDIEKHIAIAAAMDTEHSERATLLFTQMLMLRYLIVLHLEPNPRRPERTHA